MLMKIIDELTYGVFKPGLGRIYPLPFLLRQKGLIKEIETNDRKKRYELTEKGIEALKEELPVLRKILTDLLKTINEELEKP